MNIGIIGQGIVGSACEYGFKKLDHVVIVHDLKLDTKIRDIISTDVCYICVPTPSKADGSCDVSIVENVINELHEISYRGVIAIKSTVKPGTTQRLNDEAFQSKSTGNNNICFVPEFLRERCSVSDFTENHDLLAIGTHSLKDFNIIKNCHGKYPDKVVMLTPTEAELLKYYSNIFNALRIIFANEFYEICHSLNADYKKIKDAFILRGTTTDMYLDVNKNFRGYGGACLPKDTAAIASLVKELNLDMNLFNVIEQENKKFKTTVFDGMRKQ